jgi:di/tricarboxylate transporter
MNEGWVKLMVLALVIFLATYALLMALPKFRAYIAIGSAALFVILGILPASKVFFSIDWNVIMMIAGTMGTTFFFIESKVPALLADIIIDRMPNVKWAIIALSLFAGIISAVNRLPKDIHIPFKTGFPSIRPRRTI